LEEVKKELNKLTDSIANYLEDRWEKGIYEGKFDIGMEKFSFRPISVSYFIDTECKNRERNDVTSEYGYDTIAVSFNSNSGKFEKKHCKKKVKEKLYQLYKIYEEKIKQEEIYDEDIIYFFKVHLTTCRHPCIMDLIINDYLNYSFYLNELMNDDIDKLINWGRSDCGLYGRFYTISKEDLLEIYKTVSCNTINYYLDSKRGWNEERIKGDEETTKNIQDEFQKRFKITDNVDVLFKKIMERISRFYEDRFVATYDYLFDEDHTTYIII